MRQQGNGRGGLCCANSVDNATEFAREKTVPRQLSDENASEQRMFFSCGSKRGFKDGAPACSACTFQRRLESSDQTLHSRSSEGENQVVEASMMR
jgi:hypothetical protein